MMNRTDDTWPTPTPPWGAAPGTRRRPARAASSGFGSATARFVVCDLLCSVRWTYMHAMGNRLTYHSISTPDIHVCAPTDRQVQRPAVLRGVRGAHRDALQQGQGAPRAAPAAAGGGALRGASACLLFQADAWMTTVDRSVGPVLLYIYMKEPDPSKHSRPPLRRPPSSRGKVRCCVTV